MNTPVIILKVIAIGLSSLAALASIMLFLRLHWPAPILWLLKLYVSALSPLLAIIGVVSILVGISSRSVFLTSLGIYVAVIYFTHVFRVTRPPHFSSSFENAYGGDWEESIHDDQKKYFLSIRSAIMLPAVPDARMEQNVPFATIPENGRELLCDIWQPPHGVPHSGVAFIYLHGSAFYLLDKDLGTRPFFHHLAAQGHVIMDVAYRLAPETDVMGMVNDVKRAIIWLKENADKYKIDPSRIVVGGGSAGGHLAFLAAYTINDPQFTPKELERRDDSVCAVISLYGTCDFESLYYHTNQHLTRNVALSANKSAPAKMPQWMIKKMGKEYYRLGFDKGFENGTALLLGGHPDERPGTYALLSPINHVHQDCPPTLLIHGEHDVLAPVKSTRLLYARLIKEKVVTVMHIVPQTDHAFDLILPKISPSSHNAIYDVERFLALIVRKQKVEDIITDQSAFRHTSAPPLEISN